MKDNPFDDIIKSKLDKLQPVRPQDAWEEFEHVLDASESGVPKPELSHLDEVAFNKLHDLKVNQPAPNWSHLRRRMDAHLLLTQRLTKYKVVEATLVALIILLFVRFDDGGQPILPTDKQPIAASERQPDEPETLSSEASPNRQVSADQGLPPSGGSIPPVASKMTPAVGNTPVASIITPVLDAKKELSVASIKQLPANAPLGQLVAPTREEMGIKGVAEVELGTMIDEIDRSPLPLGPRPEISFKHTGSALTVSMFGGAMYNRVITPPNERSGIVGFDRYTIGYGGGVLLGLEMGRFEVGSGLGYNAVRYEPIPLLVTRGFFNAGYTAEKFDFVELNILSLPVNVRYNVIQDQRWRAYVHTGASLQVAYEANFYGIFPEDLPLPNGLIQARRGESSFSNRYGWFEGGSFRDNSFVTLNLGIGVERIFSKRWSLFVQPTYSHNLGYFSKGMGPTYDRIHSMSVLSGVRVRFKE